MKQIFQIIHWFLRMFVYACMGSSAMLLFYDFENNSWPNFHRNQRTRVRESEGRTYISYMNRGQQAYYAENGNFSNSIDNLGLGILKDTNNYSYRILSPMNPVQNVEELKPSPLDEKRKIAFATPQEADIKSYMGIVWTFPMSDGNTTTKNFVCESSKEGILYPSTVAKVLKEDMPCPPDFELLTRL